MWPQWHCVGNGVCSSPSPATQVSICRITSGTSEIQRKRARNRLWFGTCLLHSCCIAGNWGSRQNGWCDTRTTRGKCSPSVWWSANWRRVQTGERDDSNMKVGKLQFETVSSHSEKLGNRHMFHLRKSVCVWVCVKMVTGSAAKHPCNVKEVQETLYIGLELTRTVVVAK